MSALPFRQVDVFGADPLGGNPLAVVHDAQGLTPARMAEFARWTNLSETTFLLPPSPAAAASGADYRVRIFTPGGELPFAGHPTIGSCHAWLEAGGRPAEPGVVVQECGIGLVRVRRAQDRLAFAAPDLLRSGPVAPDDVRRVASALGLAPGDVLEAAWCDNGPGWIGIRVASAEVVLGLRPDMAALADDQVGVIGAYPPGAAADVEVRAFCPGHGPAEDPVTGSLNAALAQWLVPAGTLPHSYVASQGTVLVRRGRVHIDRDADGTTWVGGAAATLILGTIDLGG